MMESSAPVVATRAGRVLKQISASDLNTSSRLGTVDKADCKGLIKMMSSEKEKKTSTSTKAESPSSGTYSMLFPPGPMGLHLEPVYAADMGAQVKGYHFSSSYSGINCAVIKDKIKEGDIITLIDNIDVTQMSFKTAYNLLVTKMSSNKLVTFIKSHNNVDVEPTVNLDKDDNPPSSLEEQVVDVTDVAPHEHPHRHTISTTAALKTLFPVRYDEFSHVLSSVGTHIASLGGTVGTNLEKGMISVGLSFEDKTVEVLGNTAKYLPRYSQQEMDFVESKMCAILQELSQTCIQLGQSEEHVKSIKKQLRSVKKHTSGDNSEITQLRDTNDVLSSRVEKILHDLASEQANRDAWMARAKAAEEESQSAWEKCFETNISHNNESDANKEQQEAYVEQIVSLQEALQTANAEAEEAIQLCASEQENMQSEIALMRREQTDRRAETSAILERLNSEKLGVEQERDTLSIELEVLRDTSGADKASLDVERIRVKEAMTIQQNLHMEKLMEKEEVLYQLQDECAALKNEVFNIQNSSRTIQHENARLEEEHKETLAQLIAAKSLQLDMEAKYDTLSKEHSKTLQDIEDQEKEVHRLKEVDMLLAKTTHDCEGYMKRFENEHTHNSSLEGQLQTLRTQLVDAHSANISSDTGLSALQREFDQLQMASETDARLATEHVNRVRRRCEDRESELVEALTTADHDVVLAKREVVQLKETFAKEVVVYKQREKEMGQKMEESKEAYACLSKSKHTSESISSQQTAHLQAEVSRLLRVVSEAQQEKLQREATMLEQEKRYSALSAEKNTGVHVTLSKQLNNQVIVLKEDIVTLSHDLESKNKALDETAHKLSDAERLNAQLSGAARDMDVMQTEYEEKLHAQQRLYSDLKEKLAEDYDTKIQLLKSDMQNDMDAKISFLKMATEDKTSEESRLKKQLVGKEKEFFQLQTSYDLLEASSNSSARVAAEQIDRLRVRAEARERELLSMMKEVATVQGPGILDGTVEAGEDTPESSSNRLVKSLQREVQSLTDEMSQLHQRHLEESGEQEHTLVVAKRALVDKEQQLARAESQVETEQLKQDEYEALIREIRSKAANDSERHEEHLLAIKNDMSKEVFSLEEEIARLTCEHESERERLFVTERGLRSSCEEYLSQLRELHGEKKACAAKYDNLLADASNLQRELHGMELKGNEAHAIVSQQQLSASNTVSEMKSKHDEEISEHVHEQERLKLLLVESTTNFTSLSEKYTTLVSCRTEEVSHANESFKTQLGSIQEECGNLRLELQTLKDFHQRAHVDFAAAAEKYSQTVHQMECDHNTKTKALENKCQTLVETLEQQQQLIESANQQQKEATVNRASMLTLVDDWRNKTSEAMHTILHMQHAEAALKVAFSQEKDTVQGLRQSLLEKEAEVAQLWELVDRLADEVKKTTNRSEHLVKSIESWNSVHEAPGQLHIEPMEENSSPESSFVGSSLEKKEQIYSDISKMFPTSPENRSSRYKHLNIPKILVDSLDSSSNSILASCSEMNERDMANVITEDGNTASTYRSVEQFSSSSSSHVLFSRSVSGRSNEEEDMDAVRMSGDLEGLHPPSSSSSALLCSDEREQEQQQEQQQEQGQELTGGKDSDALSDYYDFEPDDFANQDDDEEGGEDEDEGDVSGHIIGLHDYRLDETADWYLSSDTED